MKNARWLAVVGLAAASVPLASAVENPWSQAEAALQKAFAGNAMKPVLAAAGEEDMENASRELGRLVEKLQGILDVDAMEDELADRVDMDRSQRRAAREILEDLRRHWIRGSGSVHLSSDDDEDEEEWFDDLLEQVQEEFDGRDARAVSRWLRDQRNEAEDCAEEIGEAAERIGGVAEKMAEGVAEWAEMFSGDMEKWAEDFEHEFAGDWEEWAEDYAQHWSEWGENYGKQWEDWAKDWEGQVGAWEEYGHAWEDWAEQFADEYEHQWEDWAEDYEKDWERWGEKYAQGWEDWAEQMEESGGGLNQLKGLWKNLESLEEMPLDLDSLPIIPPMPMLGEEHREVIEQLHETLNDKSLKKWKSFGQSFGKHGKGRVLDVKELRDRIHDQTSSANRDSHEDVIEQLVEEIAEERATIEAREEEMDELRDELEDLRREIEKMKREARRRDR